MAAGGPEGNRTAPALTSAVVDQPWYSAGEHNTAPVWFNPLSADECPLSGCAF